MNDYLTTEVQRIKNLAKEENYDLALRRLEQLIAEWPGEAKLWATRGYVNDRKGDPQSALTDYNRAIEICDIEPHAFYVRGILLFNLGKHLEAVADFTKVLELCDYYGSDYYREGAHFFRADSYVRLGEFSKAKADCLNVKDGMQTWTDRLRRKEDIVAECRKGLAR